MARSEGLEPPTPWFEALYSIFKIYYNQQLTMHQYRENLPSTA